MWKWSAFISFFLLIIRWQSSIYYRVPLRKTYIHIINLKLRYLRLTQLIIASTGRIAIKAGRKKKPGVIVLRNLTSLLIKLIVFITNCVNTQVWQGKIGVMVNDFSHLMAMLASSLLNTLVLLKVSRSWPVIHLKGKLPFSYWTVKTFTRALLHSS